MMVPLDDPPAGGSAPVLAKRKVETGSTEPSDEAAQAVGQARRRRNLPAGRRSARLGGGPVANKEAQAGDTVAHPLPGGECKPARRREVGLCALAGQFRNDAAERPAAERIFHGP